jgi:hypothetical protein
MNSNPMTPDEPDKSAFADEPFGGEDKNLNGAQNLFDRMDTGPIGERREGLSEMVESLFDRLGDE